MKEEYDLQEKSFGLSPGKKASRKPKISEYSINSSDIFDQDEKSYIKSDIAEKEQEKKPSQSKMKKEISERQSKSKAPEFFPSFFSKISLVRENYDCRGDHNFSGAKIPEIEFRGRIPYFKPIYGKRYGLNVSKLYDNDDWLGNINSKNEWAVAFYGLNSDRISDVALLQWLLLRNIGESILNYNLKQYQPLLNQQIGNSLCCSPLFTYQLFNKTKQFQFRNQKFRVVLQCRVLPQAIKCLEKMEQWTISNPEHFRPYAIILFTPEEIKTIGKVMSTAQMKDQFYSISYRPEDWEREYLRYKDKISMNIEQKMARLIEDKLQMNKIMRIWLESFHPKEKLRAEGIRKFSKMQMPNVQAINLQNNQIGDEGVQLLCTNMNYSNLKQIKLNDNDISTKGVSYLINNQWPKQVTYKLDTIQTKDQGYAYQIGPCISTIKGIIANRDILDFQFIQKVSAEDNPHLMRSLDLLMEVPFEENPEETFARSKEIEVKLIQQVSKYKQKHNFKPLLSHVALALKEIYKQFSEVIFSQKNTAKSQVSSNFILCGANENRVKIRHRLTNSAWDFDQFENNSGQQLKFQSWYKEFLSETYKAEKQDIVVHKIKRGSIQVESSFSIKNSLIKNSEFTSNEDISVIPFFDSFHISLDNFDPKGNYNFPERPQTQLQYRAGLPYFQPVYGTRFGLKVSKLYDHGKNDWLSMKGVPKEWAIAFHGISKPGSIPDPKFNVRQRTILEAIMSGREEGSMLKPGPRSRFKDSFAVNRPTQKIQEGIYVSPLISTVLNYSKNCKGPENSFSLPLCVVLQCRIEPNQFTVCPYKSQDATKLQDYWVINESKHIRPYGIAVFTQRQKQKILQLSKSKDFYGIKCYWKNFIEKYYVFDPRRQIRDQQGKFKKGKECKLQ